MGCSRAPPLQDVPLITVKAGGALKQGAVPLQARQPTAPFRPAARPGAAHHPPEPGGESE